MTHKVAAEGAKACITSAAPWRQILYTQTSWRDTFQTKISTLTKKNPHIFGSIYLKLKWQIEGTKK